MTPKDWKTTPLQDAEDMLDTLEHFAGLSNTRIVNAQTVDPRETIKMLVVSDGFDTFESALQETRCGFAVVAAAFEHESPDGFRGYIIVLTTGRSTTTTVSVLVGVKGDLDDVLRNIQAVAYVFREKAMEEGSNFMTNVNIHPDTKVIHLPDILEDPSTN